MQSYSGSTANYSVFAAVLEPGDKILAMSLAHGGHLTHGSPANWVSKIYQHAFYGVNKETELLDYDELERTAHEFRPKLIIAGGSLLAPHRLRANRQDRSRRRIYFMVDMAHVSGLVAAKVIRAPSRTPISLPLRRPRPSAVLERHGVLQGEVRESVGQGDLPRLHRVLHLHTMAAKAWSSDMRRRRSSARSCWLRWRTPRRWLKTLRVTDSG